MHFINGFHHSTTYIIHTGNNEYAIIDPGWPDIKTVAQWVKENNGHITSVLLTHEHADHCAGVNELFRLMPFQLFCTQACAKNIAISKQNFSLYIETIPTFEIHIPVTIIHDNQTIRLGSTDFTFYETPGHSPGSTCFRVDDDIYTGDTLMKNTKTPLNFPHSNKTEYFRSITMLKNIIQPGMTIHSGHGDPFVFGGWE